MSNGMSACAQGARGNNQFVTPLIPTPWMVLADFRSYVDAQERVAQVWQDEARWTRMSILNTASSGFFSTDRTMREYNAEIWKLK